MPPQRRRRCSQGATHPITTTSASPGLPSTPAAHAASDITSARLIQSVNQSEMRVGLRSNEFGDISIRTSTNRDVLSAQISLDHDELAKTLVAHLPELQSKVGGTQPMEVRVDMNGQGTNQQLGQQTGQGTAGGSTNQGYSSGSRQSRSASEGLAAVLEPRLAAMEAGMQSQRLDVTA